MKVQQIINLQEMVVQQIVVQRCNRLCICNVVDVLCMVSSNSRCVSAVCACSPVELFLVGVDTDCFVGTTSSIHFLKDYTQQEPDVYVTSGLRWT